MCSQWGELAAVLQLHTCTVRLSLDVGLLLGGGGNPVLLQSAPLALAMMQPQRLLGLEGSPSPWLGDCPSGGERGWLPASSQTVTHWDLRRSPALLHSALPAGASAQAAAACLFSSGCPGLELGEAHVHH